MAKAKKPANKPSTIRFRDGVVDRLDKVAEKQERSRAWLIHKYIDEGLARDERKRPAAPAGGAFA